MARLLARHCKRPYRSPAHFFSTTRKSSGPKIEPGGTPHVSIVIYRGGETIGITYDFLDTK